MTEFTEAPVLGPESGNGVIGVGVKWCEVTRRSCKR